MDLCVNDVNDGYLATVKEQLKRFSEFQVGIESVTSVTPVTEGVGLSFSTLH